MHYIGLMSGTSVDGIDAVAVSIGAEHEFKLLASLIQPFPRGIAERIGALMKPGSDGLDAYGALDMELGNLFAQAALAVAAKAKLAPKDVRAIGNHGQTVRHRPNDKTPFTLQIGNPAMIAERTGITTVANFRARDIAAGGQGAPLVPAFHRWLFHSPSNARAIVNIGGIANITHVPTSGPVTGFDTGPGNTLLDQWTECYTGNRYDEEGKWAATGQVSSSLLQKLLSDPYFAAPPPKSTGREYFNLDWLDAALTSLPELLQQDVQATLVELTARSIVDGLAQLSQRTDEVYFCGGGSHNKVLMQTLERQLSGMDVSTTDSLGLHPDFVEASAFAWLAHRTLEGVAGNVPSVTGARHSVILGGIYKA